MRYTTDLSDNEGRLLQPCFSKPSTTGRPREPRYRERLNATFYLVRPACQWRNLPKAFAPWGAVYPSFRAGKKSGLWERLHTRLRPWVRQAQPRESQPSAGIVDRQSVKRSECRDERGYDAGKKINGRKRPLLVDTIGLVLLVMVLPAHIQDRDGARKLLEKHFGRRPRRRVNHLWADGGDAGSLVGWALTLWRCRVAIVNRTDAHTFKSLPRRWVVARAFGWLNRYRRRSRDYERQAQTGETMVYVAMIRLMLARLVTNS